ncbi:sensor histidine kinase [Polaribacter sp. SA4-12]|uniref:sensor histidine kinase n=1 Tax=Polaribacter sp. SA4-12 TaxID=1312072 RepID=UPI000B3D25B8|nr:histidine kinase [Polaribacter sp. SA4-12]ARV15208.1 histidine kinase [Polaribacter sp. SA4-12]
MKLSQNKFYIIFNLFGWFLLFTATLAGPKLFLSNEVLASERVLYYWLETIACAILAFMCTFIISFFIDTKINFNNSWKTTTSKILVIFLTVQALYSLFIWPILDFVQEYAKYESDSVMTLGGKIYNVFYFATLFIIWLFVFLTIKIYHQLKTVQIRQLQLEANLKESQLNTLKGQINPHFMFNSLNNIRGLMLEDVGKARNMLTSLSETLRYSLTKSDVNSISLEDELEMVENYIAISKIQFENRLQFETHIDPESLSKQIPPMIIQMLIENALKHGISNLKNGGKVNLSTKIEGNQLHIEVANSGKLHENKNSTQLGVKNIKKRLELLYGKAAVFSLKEIENQVVATIKIPLT